MAADLAATFYYKSAEQCPDRAKHTPDPPGYPAWHEWAEKKAKTHEQRQCPTCGFWVIWKRKPKSESAYVDAPVGIVMDCEPRGVARRSCRGGRARDVDASSFPRQPS